MTDFTAPVHLDDDDSDDKKDKPGAPMVDKHLFDSRTVLITGQVTMDMARDVCARLLALAQVSDDPILVVVSSPGGHVESGDMIHDMVKFIGPQVKMLGTGWVASAGALIYCSVPKERRYATPNTRFLLHQPSGGAGGAASDIAIQAREIIRMRERLNKIFAAATGQKLERIEEDTDRDFWMDNEEAMKYGLVGKIVESRNDIAM